MTCDKLIDMSTVTVSPKFQVVIPAEIRRRFGIEPGARLQLVELGGSLRLLPQRPPSALRGIARGIDTSVPNEPDRTL